MPLSDDFARWRDDPITRLVFKALDAAADAQKQQWDEAAWNGGKARAAELERLLLELRVRADCYRALEELSVSDIMNWLEIDHEQ